MIPLSTKKILMQCYIMQTTAFKAILARRISLRVAAPTPREKTGGRERLRKAGTNRVM